MSGVTPSRMVGSKKNGPRSGRARPPASTRAPFATASSTWAVTASSCLSEESGPMSLPQSSAAPSLIAAVRATNRSTNAS